MGVDSVDGGMIQSGGVEPGGQMGGPIGGQLGGGSIEIMGVWLVIAAVIAVVGGIVLYFTFLSRKNDGRFKGFVGWIYDFLSFKKLTIENILKLTYLILAIFTTLGSFASIPTSFVLFLVILILGNLVLRILYEVSLVLLVICRNTTEINTKLNKDWKKEEK